jgi:hypothetical protein
MSFELSNSVPLIDLPNLYGSLTVGLRRNLKYVDFKKSPSFSVSLNLKIGSKIENNLKYELLINLTK